MKYFDEIERRLKGQMSASEAEAFDQELQRNEELAKEYELQKMEEDILDFAVEDDLLARIQAIGKEKTETTATTEKTSVLNVHRWRRIMSLAAGAAILIAAYFALRYSLGPAKPRALALAAYRELPPNLSGTKSMGSDPQAWDANKQLLLTGKKEDIQRAVAFFEGQKAQTPEAAYYLGHGYWNLEDYEKAVLNFEYFLDNVESDDRLFSAAEYYKSLSLLALNRVEEAQDFILASKAGHPFENPWDDILEKLRN